ncbi:hypothetical protein CEP51_016272 [Fusarium floridanum]|uniref:Cation-transporting P-type ATPase N-terminal domain-containing protein n=1 Tax=Fusarium floridanum TaxID=1325733 RepID=A0A428NTP9_9HYPO|nr:hypothetical protein CEP51_016272 [Fusarium floridanum]
MWPGRKRRGEVAATHSTSGLQGRNRTWLSRGNDLGVPSLDTVQFEWHALSVPEVIHQLSTSTTTGLLASQVSEKLTCYGDNAVSPIRNRIAKRILGYLFKGFGTVLFVATILAFTAWGIGQPPAPADLALAIALLAVFHIQAGFNIWQDWSSRREMASMMRMLPECCKVLRDGANCDILVDQIVPGDILFIETGDRLPADIRFTEVSPSAKFDRSLVTGESMPLHAAVTTTDNSYLESNNIGLQGTYCVSGKSTGVVVATGDNTILGRIMKQTNSPSNRKSPLAREVTNFIILICSAVAVVVAAFIIVWSVWLRKRYPDWITVPNLLILCISVTVAFLPVGLPVAVTAGMTVSAKIMRQHRILCKSLDSVETLGSVSTLCIDKTGTLTQNKMFVTHCTVGSTQTTLDEARDTLEAYPAGSVFQLWTVAGLCNSSEFDDPTAELPIHERTTHGDATDQAIFHFSEQLHEVATLHQSWKLVSEIPFDSKSKYMAKAFRPVNEHVLPRMCPTTGPCTSNILITVKGAPDILLGRVSTYLADSGAHACFDSNVRQHIEGIVQEWAVRGLRLVLLAHKTFQDTVFSSPEDSSELDMESQMRAGLTLTGLVGIADPLRPGTFNTITTLRKAGIRIFMLTGDLAHTAQAIGVECGILTTTQVDTVEALYCSHTIDPSLQALQLGIDLHVRSDAIVLSGQEIGSLAKDHWDRLCRYREVIVARTTPEQKLQVIRELQSRGEIVGMVGDGINDSPGLRAADIGITIGSGSNTAIAAADLVLLGSLSAIVEALRCSRLMFDNLKKTVAYLLPAGSFSEFWPVFTYVVFGLPQILSSFLMIIICLFTDAVAAVSLTYEKPEGDVLLRKPRAPGRNRLVDWQLILQAYGLAGMLEMSLSFIMAYWYLQRKGIPFSDIWFTFGNLPDTIEPDYYQQQLNVASSIYFVNVVVMQWFNLLAVRTRRLSVFQQPPLFNKATNNLFLFPAIAFAFIMAIFWLYVPEFQKVLNTSPVPVENWFMAVVFGLLVLLVDELRKYMVRKRPRNLLASMAW